MNWIYYAALTMLSGDYASATNDIQRAAYVAAANYPSAVIASPLALAYAIGTLSFGILIIGFLMLKGIFSKVGHGCGRRLEHSSDSECGLRDSLALFCGLQTDPALSDVKQGASAVARAIKVASMGCKTPAAELRHNKASFFMP